MKTGVKTKRKDEVEKETDRILRSVVRIITSDYGPVERIIFFGSRARGEGNRESDFDFIIIKETKERFIKRLGRVPMLPIAADVFVYTPEEFRRMTESRNGFIKNALRGSRVIYER